jgi:hypothetical protein
MFTEISKLSHLDMLKTSQLFDSSPSVIGSRKTNMKYHAFETSGPEGRLTGYEIDAVKGRRLERPADPIQLSDIECAYPVAATSYGTPVLKILPSILSHFVYFHLREIQARTAYALKSIGDSSMYGFVVDFGYERQCHAMCGAGQRIASFKRIAL